MEQNPFAVYSSFLASVATLITKENFSELQLRFETMNDW